MRSRKCRITVEPPPLPERREPRIAVGVRSWMRVVERREEIELIDISANGLGGRTDMPLPIGAEVRVWVPGRGELRAQIRWALCGLFGARFVTRTPEQIEEPTGPTVVTIQDMVDEHEPA